MTAGPAPTFQGEPKWQRESHGQEIVTIDNNEIGFHHRSSPDSPSSVLGLEWRGRGREYMLKNETYQLKENQKEKYQFAIYLLLLCFFTHGII